jgi:hypothetical protein
MRKMAMILSIFMLMAFSAAIASSTAAAKSSKMETVDANVVKVEVSAGEIVVMVNGREETLKAKKKLLKSVKDGDMVSIEKSGKTVKSIKVVAAPPAAVPIATMAPGAPMPPAAGNPGK